MLYHGVTAYLLCCKVGSGPDIRIMDDRTVLV
jgi:hypothetical protein